MSASAPPPNNPGYPGEQQPYPAPYPTQQEQGYPQAPVNEKAPYPGDPVYPQQQDIAYPPQQQATYPQQQQQPYPAQQNQGPPPSYYPQQATYPAQQGYTAQPQANVVLVQQQPTTVAYGGGTRYSDAGNGALIFSIVLTFIAVFGGCWWALACTVPAILLASSATSAATRGDVDRANTNEKISICCSVVGLVFGILGILALIAGLAAYYGIIFSRFG